MSAQQVSAERSRLSAQMGWVSRAHRSPHLKSFGAGFWCAASSSFAGGSGRRSSLASRWKQPALKSTCRIPGYRPFSWLMRGTYTVRIFAVCMAGAGRCRRLDCYFRIRPQPGSSAPGTRFVFRPGAMIILQAAWLAVLGVTCWLWFAPWAGLRRRTSVPAANPT